MDKEFKIYYGSMPANQDQLDAIEEITVEQEVGHVWEARIKIPVCIGEDGSWEKENDLAYKEGERVRIEARIGDGDFVVLIDGRIMSQHPDYNASPGLSNVTLIVQDDTTQLHGRAETVTFAESSDKEIASGIFEAAPFHGLIDIDEDLPDHPDTNVILNQRGTSMDTLRSIAARHRDYYVYLLPSDTLGKSDCFLKKLPTEPDSGLAPLFLEGPNRNMSQFAIRQNSSRLSTFESQALNVSDNSVVPGVSEDIAPAADEPATQLHADDIRHQRLAPGQGYFAHPAVASTGAAAASSYTLSAEGSVLPSCYPSILMPYKRVPVRLSNSKYSTSYVIFKVTHTLGRSEYTQSFSMRGDSVSSDTAVSAAAPAPAAAAGALAAILNIQADIF